MAGKTSGLGDNLYIDGFDLSGDIMAVNKISGGPAPLDMTSINKSAYARIGGLRDGNMDITSFFNPGPEANAAHTILKTLPTTDRMITYCRGTTVGSAAACLISKQANYDPKRAQSGELTFNVNALANAFGLDWGRQVAAGPRTDVAATNGAGVDFGLGSSGTGPSVFGLQAYLQVFAFTGTSATIKLQESTDNGGADPYADTTGGAFTAVTGVTTQRIATAGGQTVKEWIRVVTSGTFSNVQFSVVVNRNDATTAF